MIKKIAEELPDDYFTPTITDLKARQQHLHARAVATNNAPLLTRAQREQQAKMKRDRWPNVRTVQFSISPLNNFVPYIMFDRLIIWRFWRFGIIII